MRDGRCEELIKGIFVKPLNRRKSSGANKTLITNERYKFSGM